MNITDFIIGALLMNAMPHFVLGIWGGRMFSAFGFGNRQNIAYGLCCFGASLWLFLRKYGLETLYQNGILMGALAILVIYFLTGRFWQQLFKEKN